MRPPPRPPPFLPPRPRPHFLCPPAHCWPRTTHNEAPAMSPRPPIVRTEPLPVTRTCNPPCAHPHRPPSCLPPRPMRPPLTLPLSPFPAALPYLAHELLAYAVHELMRGAEHQQVGVPHRLLDGGHGAHVGAQAEAGKVLENGGRGVGGTGRGGGRHYRRWLSGLRGGGGEAGHKQGWAEGVANMQRSSSPALAVAHLLPTDPHAHAPPPSPHLGVLVRLVDHLRQLAALRGAVGGATVASPLVGVQQKK